MKENHHTVTPRQNKNLQQGQKKIEKYVFSLNKPIGKGSYATVYLGRRIYDDFPTAIKVIDKKIFANAYNIKTIQSEIQIMKKLEAHKNLVGLYDVYQTNNNMYIVTQLCEEGDLRNFIKRKKRVPEYEAIKILRDIVLGFKYLYQHEIIHRDLKPANILIHQGRCKISDFGFAKNLEFGQNTIMKSIVGTPLYMSPQILNKQSYTNKSDLWSVGLIFYEMIYGHTPWPANNEFELLNKIMTRSIPFDQNISDVSKDFIKKCLRIKEDDRMSWEETFNHSLINENLNLNLARAKLEERMERNRFEERQNKISSHRSKTKSAKKKNSNLSRSPIHNKGTSKTPRGKNRNLTPDNKCPWKF